MELSIFIGPHERAWVAISKESQIERDARITSNKVKSDPCNNEENPTRDKEIDCEESNKE
jgi:hypothetical protein